MAQTIESACNVGDPGLIPGSGTSPEEGNGNPLQYSRVESPMDGGAWQATVHGAANSQIPWFHFPHFTFLSGRAWPSCVSISGLHASVSLSHSFSPANNWQQSSPLPLFSYKAVWCSAQRSELEPGKSNPGTFA